MTLMQEFRDLAVELLGTFEAQSATLRNVARSFDPATRLSTETNTDTVTTTVIRPEESRNRDGQTVVNTVATIAAQGLSVVPAVDDILITASKSYRISDVMTVSPSGVVILFKCKLGDL